MISVFLFVEQDRLAGDDQSSSTGFAVGIPIFVCFILIGLGVVFKMWISKTRNICDLEDVGNKRMSMEDPKVKSRWISFTDVVSGSIKEPNIKEFDDLVSFKDDDLGQRFTRFQGKRFNKIGSLNLVPSVLPFDHNRVILKHPINGYDYVAVMIT